MVLPMELDGTPFTAEGLRSTKQVDHRAFPPECQSQYYLT